MTQPDETVEGGHRLRLPFFLALPENRLGQHYRCHCHMIAMQGGYACPASGRSEVFIRSKTLFLRPAWIEDGARLQHLNAPSAFHPPHGPNPSHDTQRHAFVVTMPHACARIIGAATLRANGNDWQKAAWIAPAYRNLGLDAEMEAALASLTQVLPTPDGGQLAMRAPELIAA
ncbi:hypothetical protein [Croceicoccus hydrothermalis]|uniref:hypothetical protein n=1 Tax=Croceicoccus hydrothermalis TaxID=2867964 RepID=UPI001EFABE28|nr:hypothetical protein [Croceicoccus hydrothermalis]